MQEYDLCSKSPSRFSFLCQIAILCGALLQHKGLSVLHLSHSPSRATQTDRVGGWETAQAVGISHGKVTQRRRTTSSDIFLIIIIILSIFIIQHKTYSKHEQNILNEREEIMWLSPQRHAAFKNTSKAGFFFFFYGNFSRQHFSKEVWKQDPFEAGRSRRSCTITAVKKIHLSPV